MSIKAYAPEAGFVWNPLAQWPRNAACFCGSGLKFKGCHRDRIPQTVPSERGRALYTAMAQGEKGLEVIRGYFVAKYPLPNRRQPGQP